MISVFGSFIFGGTITIASIGFVLAFGVLVDAFLIRMTFVPGVHTLLGDRAWHLPRWIHQILPKVDTEGKHLQKPSATGPRSRRPRPDFTAQYHARGRATATTVGSSSFGEASSGINQAHHPLCLGS